MNPDDKISASVSIRIEVEVTVGNWGAASSFASLREQAMKEATHALSNHLQTKGNMRVVGKPTSMRVTLKGDLGE